MKSVKEVHEKPASIITECTDSKIESIEAKKENKKRRWKLVDPLKWKINKELQEKETDCRTKVRIERYVLLKVQDVVTIIAINAKKSLMKKNV